MKKVATLISIIFLSGCSHMLTSNQQANGDNSPITTSDVGLSYYLPKRLHEVEIKAIPFNANIDKLIQKTTKSLLKVLGEKSKEAEVINSNKLVCTDLTEQLKFIDNKKLKEEVDIKKQKACSLYNVAKDKLKTIEVKLQTVQSSLDEAYSARHKIKSSTNNAECVYSLSLSVKDKGLFPDTRRGFIANLNHSYFHDDDLKLSVTPSGLLTNAVGVTNDRTGDVVVEIAKAIATFTGFPSGSLLGETEAFFSEQKSITPPVLCKSKDIKLTLDLEDLTELNARLKNSGLEVEVCGFNGKKDGCWGNTALPLSDLPSPIIGENDLMFSDKNEDYIGLFYRRELPYIVKLFSTDKSSNSKSLKLAKLVTMPNRSLLAQVPFKSGFMVKNEHDVSFENGMLTSSKTIQPSEALAVSQLPLNVVRGIIGSMSEIIKLRFDFTQEQKNLTSEQALLLEKLVELEKAIEEKEKNSTQ